MSRADGTSAGSTVAQSPLQEARWRLALREDDLVFAEYAGIAWRDTLERLRWWKLRKRLQRLERELTE